MHSSSLASKVREVRKKNILFFLFPLLSFILTTTSVSAQKVVSGIVTDTAGTPLPNVTVQVKGTSRTVASNSTGRFSIEANENDRLVFSTVGYVATEVAAAAASTVVLTSRSVALGEVVVVGYGTRRRQDLTSSIVSIKGEDLRKSPVATIDQALQGRAAGVQVTSSTGDPGGAI